MISYSYRMSASRDITNPGESMRFTRFFIEADVALTDKPSMPEGKPAITRINGTVTITNQVPWPELAKSDPETRVKIFFELGRREVVNKLRKGENTGEFKIELNRDSAPKACPHDPAEIEIDLGVWHQVKAK